MKYYIYIILYLGQRGHDLLSASNRAVAILILPGVQLTSDTCQPVDNINSCLTFLTV